MNGRQVATTLLAALGLVAVGFLAGKAFASGADPGSDADPLVSKSYVDQIIATLAPKSYVDQQVSNLATKAYVDQLTAGLQNKGNASFGVVLLPKGASLIGESGTEIVLRAGQATAIVSEKGGVLDSTAGIDLAKDAAIKPNHLLIIPVTDGRGLTAKADAILIVKGPFTVKPAGQ